jgi:hypothetical protein
MAVSPPSLFVFPDGPELPGAEEVFSASDYPTGMSTGNVRGHVAWLSEGDPSAACSAQGPAVDVPSDFQVQDCSENGPQALIECPTPYPPSEPPEIDSCLGLPDGTEVLCSARLPATMYDTSLTSSIQWKEQGAIIELVGPYDVGQLIALVEERAGADVEVGPGIFWL